MKEGRITYILNGKKEKWVGYKKSLKKKYPNARILTIHPYKK